MRDDLQKLIDHNLSLGTPDAKAFADDLAVIYHIKLSFYFCA